ncbi:unnamed protein product [Fusarium graminearum]|uniref:Uncharacterized protein n=1 Tax=Gibberella zeae TaxID=5518 RepID=A0A9N8RS13_GIBZA|nr:unnamed protein product [Fusarium graminearum]
MSLMDRDEGIVLQQYHLETTKHYPIKRIQVSFDDKKIAVHSEITAWLFDVQTVLANLPKKTYGHILDDGVTIASHERVTMIEIENPIAEVITTLGIRNARDGEVNCMALSPDGQLFAYDDWPGSGQYPSSISIWHLNSGSLRFRNDISDKIHFIAISPSAGSRDLWIAVGMLSKLLVWDVNTTQFHCSIDFSYMGKYPAKVFFSGSRMGVLWGPFPEFGRYFTDLFICYNINTGRRLSQLDFPPSSSKDPHCKYFNTNTTSRNGAYYVVSSVNP